MKYKVICRIQNEQKGLHEYPLFIEAQDKKEAERSAKYYICSNMANTIFWGIKVITPC